jgi:thiamine-phosphate pyrophosphorylase
MPSFDLIVVTDERPDLIARITRALAGVPPRRLAIQLRLPASPSAKLLEVALELRALTRAHQSTLLINDRVDVALAVEADGIQLPEHGLPVEIARRLLGSQRWVGASRHDLKGLFEAARQGADYATLSPIHPVPGKGTPLGIAGFARTIAAVRLPVYALGGVRAADVDELRQSGARGVAVVREVLSAADPAHAVSELLSLLGPSRPD